MPKNFFDRNVKDDLVTAGRWPNYLYPEEMDKEERDILDSLLTDCPTEWQSRG